MPILSSRDLHFNSELNYKTQKESNLLFVSRIELLKSLRNISSCMIIKKHFNLYKLQFTKLASRIHLPHYTGFEPQYDSRTNRFSDQQTRKLIASDYEYFLNRCCKILEDNSRYQLVCPLLFFEGLYSLYSRHLSEQDLNFRVLFTNYASTELVLTTIARRFDYKKIAFDDIDGFFITPSVHGVYWSDVENAKQIGLLSGSDILYGQYTLWFPKDSSFERCVTIMNTLKDRSIHFTMHWIHEQDYQLHCHLFYHIDSLIKYLLRISVTMIKGSSSRSVPSILLISNYENLLIRKMFCLFSGCKFAGVPDDFEFTYNMAVEAISCLPPLSEFDQMILQDKFLLNEAHCAYRRRENHSLLIKVAFNQSPIDNISSKYISGKPVYHVSTYRTRCSQYECYSTLANVINLDSTPCRIGSSFMYTNAKLMLGPGVDIIERNKGWIESLKHFRETKVDVKTEIDNIMSGAMLSHINRIDTVSRVRKIIARELSTAISRVQDVQHKINASFLKLISIFSYLLFSGIGIGRINLGPHKDIHIDKSIRSVLILGSIDDPLIPFLRSLGITVQSYGLQALGYSKRARIPFCPNPGPNDLIISDIGNSFEDTTHEYDAQLPVIDWMLLVSEWAIIVFKVISLTPHIFSRFNKYIQDRCCELDISQTREENGVKFSNIKVDAIFPHFRKYGSFEGYIFIIKNDDANNPIDIHLSHLHHPFINTRDVSKDAIITIKKPKQLNHSDVYHEENWGRPILTLGTTNLPRQLHSICFVNSVCKHFLTYPVGTHSSVGVANFGVINPGASILSKRFGPFNCDSFLYNFNVTGDRGDCDINQFNYVTPNQMAGHMFKVFISEQKILNLVVVGLREIDDFILFKFANKIVVRDLSVNILPEIKDIVYVHGDALPWITSRNDEHDVVGQTVCAIDVFMAYDEENDSLKLIIERIAELNETWYVTFYCMTEVDYKYMKDNSVHLVGAKMSESEDPINNETFNVKLTCGRYKPVYIWKWESLVKYCELHKVTINKIEVSTEYYYKCISYGYRPTGDAITLLDNINSFYYCCRLFKSVN